MEFRIEVITTLVCLGAGLGSADTNTTMLLRASSLSYTDDDQMDTHAGGFHSVHRRVEVSHGILALVSTICGGGSLSIPWAFARSGVFVGLLVLILSAWLSALLSSRDVLWRWSDPLPGLLWPLGYLYFAWVAWRERISAVEASTFDIEWNSERSGSREK